MNVIKRDGKIQEFNVQKILYAINKAFKSADIEFTDEIKAKVEDYFTKLYGKQTADIKVDDIHDAVEVYLSKKFPKVGKAYILKRKERDDAREANSKLIKQLNSKLNASNIENQNANLDEASFGGRIGEASRVVCKNDALKNRMSKKARENHENNEIYIHDLDSYSVGEHNCLSMPFDKLLAEGFSTRQADVRPANSINTAMQLVAVIFQLQSLQQFGGVSATHLDWTMVPYIRKSFYKHYKDGVKYLENKEIDYSFNDSLSIEDPDYKAYSESAYKYAFDMTVKECHQAVEGLFHNLNTLQSRSGNQLPFTSINYGTCVLSEGRMVIDAILDVTMEGTGPKHKTSIFPCGIFQYKKGVNDRPGTPNYDLYRKALKSTSLRIYPNYANCDWSVQKNAELSVGLNLDEYFKDIDKKPLNDVLEKMGCIMSTMGCRTYNGLDINGLGALKDGRGNICPVTIILPTIAMKAKQYCEEQTSGMYNDEMLVRYFMEMLDTKIHEAKDMLIERFNWICSQSPKSAAFMYENNTMAGYVPEEGIISALKHGTIVIGQLGLAETLQILINCDHTTEKGMELAKEIEGLYNKRCAEFKKEYLLNFGVYYTPAENLCYTAFKKWKAEYGDVEGVTYYLDEDGNKHDKLYFTNSMHVPVYKDMDPFKKIDIESQLTGYSNAGCITYIELPSGSSNNIDAMETIVNYAMDHDIPYFALNFQLDTCNNCGETGEFNGVCPYCGSDDIDELRRVTGYLSTTKKNFNKGKQVETDQRVQHFKH